MGDGPVSGAAEAPAPADQAKHWRLAAGPAGRAQGLVASPFAHLPEGLALLLDTSAAPGPGWLRTLLGDGGLAITPAKGMAVDASKATLPCAAIAFSAAGLSNLRLPDAVLASFAVPFQQGMHEAYRRRRLGDAPRPNDHEPPSDPRWTGGNSAEPTFAAPPTRAHAAVLLYGANAAMLDTQEALVRQRLGAAAVARRLRLSLNFDTVNTVGVSREHFGFADGISQPVPFGEAILTRDGAPYVEPHPVHGMAAGDLLLGHCNAHREPAPSPYVPGSDARAQALPEGNGVPEGTRNLGLDGSYLVIRELTQDVAAFWDSMRQIAGALGVPDDWVAERVVGRTRDGEILAPKPQPGTRDDGPWNDFLFYEDDRAGPHPLCPLGSHIRRSNPRDGLAPGAGEAAGLLASVNRHRIMRRGRKFAADATTGGMPGLLFMCLNTDLERQFEFVQQTWLQNPGFATLFDEVDPLVGPRGRFTVPAVPVRRRPTVDTFVHFVGGDYFFLPSLPALDYLMGL